MPLPPTLISTDEDPFEDEEEPSKEEQLGDEMGGVPADSSRYLDSSSHQECEETQEEGPTKSKSSPKTVDPLPLSSLSIHAPGPRVITTPRKSISILSHKREAPPPSSPNPSKKPCLTHK
ncbi:unnamed protein product [Lactuca saligna]|uniref:Uncharacterized protein n=1 Tax=Lactuca saligna TaxID=75948 RepID=A0AA36EAJ4_LACSI|nr:unnamed protein product [Lactuca saligna]